MRTIAFVNFSISSDRLEQLLMEDLCNSESNITNGNEAQAIEWSQVYPFMINVRGTIYWETFFKNDYKN